MLDLVADRMALQMAAAVIGGGALWLSVWISEFKRQEVAVATAQAEVFRWMVRADLPAVLAIERTSVVEPWSEADLVAALMDRDTMGLVLERRGRVAGYLIYRSHAHASQILRFAVHTLHRRMAIGRSLIERLVNRPMKRRVFWASVPETNLPAQLFLRSMGFHALPPARDATSYRFVLELE